KLRRGRFFGDLLGQQFLRAARPKRGTPCDYLVHRGPKAVNVRPRIQALATDLLRRHVAARAGDVAFLVKELAAGDALGQGEIDQTHLAGAVHHDVVRLDVTVDPAARAHVSEGRGRLLEDVVGLFLDEVPFLVHDPQLEV